MKWMSGFSVAASSVAAPMANPTVTMTSAPASTWDCMLAAYSDSSWVTTAVGSAAPMVAAPCSAPSQLYWLKFRSSSVPTSVTTPMTRSLVPVGSADGGGAATLSPISRQRPLPTSIVPPVQAASTMTAVTRSAKYPYL